MFPIMHIGPFSLQTNGLIILIGLWLGLSISERFSPIHKVKPVEIYNLAFILILGSIIGGRITYVIQYFDAFRNNLLTLFTFSTSMIDLAGGILIAGIIGWFYIQRRQISIWSILDALTPAFSVLLITFHLANFASGDGFGTPTTLPWKIFLWGEYRHPTQIYETITAIIILLLIWPRLSLPAGFRFLTFTSLSALARILFEFFRGDSLLIFGAIRSAQAAGWLILLISLWLIKRRMQTSWVFMEKQS